MPRRPRTLASAVMALVLAAPVFAQHTPPAERVIRMNGAAPTAAGTQASLRFAIYDAETDGTLLWQETQTVTVDQTGQYTAFLGAMAADGLPLGVFAGGAPRWLAVEGPSGAVGRRTLQQPLHVHDRTVHHAHCVAGADRAQVVAAPVVEHDGGAVDQGLQVPLPGDGEVDRRQADDAIGQRNHR